VKGPQARQVGTDLKVHQDQQEILFRRRREVQTTAPRQAPTLRKTLRLQISLHLTAQQKLSTYGWKRATPSIRMAIKRVSQKP
jgi:hypothetical protein